MAILETFRVFHRKAFIDFGSEAIDKRSVFERTSRSKRGYRVRTATKSIWTIAVKNVQ